MLSQTAEYALRAAVCLAASPDERLTTPRIAAITRVPAGYLSKVLQALARAGLVESYRGLGGGFVLARPAAELTVLEVINAVDPIRRITTCPLHIAAHGTSLCPLHRRLDGAIAAVEVAFAATTIAEILAEPEGAGFCQFPTATAAPAPAPADDPGPPAPR